MIREHAFNSAWWGSKVGIVYDQALFALPAPEQEALLSDYAWVEFVAPLEGSPSPRVLQRVGFHQVDTQIRFRISLKGIPTRSTPDMLQVASASEHEFQIPQESMRPFRLERFQCLPSITEEKLNSRYALWANALIHEHPEWCLEIRQGATVQGWFLSHPSADGLDLTLAVLSRQACISGLVLYQAALSEYARRGRTIGSARFSVRNCAVHGIYASLGARFLSPYGCWLWLPTEAELAAVRSFDQSAARRA